MPKEKKVKKNKRKNSRYFADTIPMATPTQQRKVFIGGLLKTTTEGELRDYFRRYGPIEESVIMTDRKS